MLDSTTADICNCAAVGLPDAILASLFLEKFVADVPWAHIDIAGTAQSGAAKKWLNHGTTGFGTRLLIDLALNFQA